MEITFDKILKHTCLHTPSHTFYLIGLCVVCHGSSHDDSRVQTVLDSLDKRVLLVLWCFSEAFTDVFQSSDRLIAQLHPRLSGDYFNLSCNQEPQSTTGPRDGMEQIRVLFLCDKKYSIWTRIYWSKVWGDMILILVIFMLVFIIRLFFFFNYHQHQYDINWNDQITVGEKNDTHWGKINTTKLKIRRQLKFYFYIF